jgi:hypothetical protein
MSMQLSLRRGLCLLGCVVGLFPSLHAAEPLQLAWTNNLLTISGAQVPGGSIDIWYLEAFLRSGANGRDWKQTVMPHRTRLVSAEQKGHTLKFVTTVEPAIEVQHEVKASDDVVDLQFTLENKGKEDADLQWLQPACIRVAKFTGTNQQGYTARSFIFTDRGLTTLNATRRTEEAIYRGGQVYVPQGIPHVEANPRPISLDAPVNGLIGCFSADNRMILATASDRTHELFEGVYVCLHSDPHVGGLKAGERKEVRSRIYLVPNDPEKLLARYKKDFPR